jgi:hypothetical protein
MRRKSTKYNLPEHSPDESVWQRIDSAMDSERMEEFGLPEHAAPDTVWSKLEGELDRKEPNAYRKFWLRAAAAVILLIGIAAVFFLVGNDQNVRHEVVIAEVSQSSIEDIEVSASELLKTFQSGSENSGVSSLMAELKQLEKDKQLILQKMKTDDSPHMHQLLMEIELDMAALVREISNELR